MFLIINVNLAPISKFKFRSFTLVAFMQINDILKGFHKREFELTKAGEQNNKTEEE